FKTITINVVAVNDPPQGTAGAVNLASGVSYVFTAANFRFTDPNDNPANHFLAMKITTLPAVGTLSDNGVAVAAGQFVSITDINAGNLVFTPGANASGNNYASFTFQVQDDGGTLNGGVDTDPTPRLMTLNYTGCDPAPAGIVGWWQGEGNSVDIINGNNGTLH